MAIKNSQDEPNVCEERTYNALYSAHGQALWNFAYYKCGNADDASDLVQEAFVKLWNNCSKVSFAKARSFLYTVTNNSFLNAVAHQKVVLNYRSMQSSGVDKQSPEFLLEEKEYGKKLNAALNTLTEAQRTAFLMNRIDGKKYKQIAEELDISVKAVEKRISQALVSLKKNLDGFNK
ncbi:sigma-70 family RNA polymerase sigma factor [Gilvibacter sp.]|uniref:RNA polymerase sigma factor n=1 Tax=Gilvibacter sp. TaxID=2729997 RepID=UPI0025BC4AEF|nr:sigma-70 family RNA polymerase sigma factor [Gilvibacter sp.]NQX77730.1 sigma-70 family RNA polymerase sigma factor [Gilvibacter sp.]